ncbi:cobalamin-binding protein [Halobacillus sp. Marseille-Q1614]|uniref:cobalamin-binding protein n=1 Tax=Halobacillus sp. Marseille-Q1614 TaxID=2709134 RepID=UPI00156F44A9|nr:cobalamin-binding protein [Halobacillus sp. Marseille-Q1614]
MRIVSICPSNTEIVAYLELDELLIGVDNYSDFPKKVKELPQLGPDLSINMENLAELNPDLVLASLSVPGMEVNIEGLEERGIPYIILNPGSLKEIAEDIERVGEVLGFKDRGKEKARQFLQEIENYKEKNKDIKERPALYWEWWPKPIFTPGGGNWLTEISELAGGKNIFGKKQEASLQMGWDEVLEADPAHICMVWVGVKEEKMNPELVKKRPGWSEMKAVQNGYIHVLEESLYCRPSPRLLEGLKKLDRLLDFY